MGWGEVRPVRLAEIGHDDADTFEGMSGRLHEAEAALAEADFIAVLDVDVREVYAGSAAEVDLRSGAAGQVRDGRRRSRHGGASR